MQNLYQVDIPQSHLQQLPLYGFLVTDNIVILMLGISYGNLNSRVSRAAAAKRT